MSEFEVTQTATAQTDADGQYDLFAETRRTNVSSGKSVMRWQELDDALEDLGSLRMTEHVKRLAITPVLLVELAFVRDGWRWPSSLDSTDLLDVMSSPKRTGSPPRRR